MTKRLTAVMLALTMLLCGCGAHQPAQSRTTKKTICVVLKAMDSVHWMYVENGLKQAASDYGVSVNILYPKSESDTEAQMTMLRDAIASKPDALAIAPCDADRMDILDRAEKNGIKVYYIDSKSERHTCPYIGSDNKTIGELAARELTACIDEGEVAVITGSMQQSTHNERAQGFLEFIGQNSSLEVCEVKENPDSSDVESMESMRDILKEHPEVKGVFCSSAMMVLGALQARNEQKRSDVLLVGVDTQSDALLAVEQGDILAMIGQDGYQIGYQTIKTIVQNLNGLKIAEDETICVENELITQANVKESLADYGKWD